MNFCLLVGDLVKQVTLFSPNGWRTGSKEDREGECFRSAGDGKSLPSLVHCIRATKEWVMPLT